MKDLKAFMAKVSEDQGLAKKVMAAKDTAEVVSIAAAAGYKFTEDDLMDEQMSQVAGGKGFSFSGMVSSFTNGVNNASQKIKSDADAVSGAADATANLVGTASDSAKQALSSVKNAANDMFQPFRR